MYPLKFKPIFKTIVWGGEKIAPYKGVETTQEHIGESWELSGVKGNESVVANGALAGKTIAELVKEYKGCLVGEHVYANTGDEFPLLIKFIDDMLLRRLHALVGRYFFTTPDDGFEDRFKFQRIHGIKRLIVPGRSRRRPRRWPWRRRFGKSSRRCASAGRR